MPVNYDKLWMVRSVLDSAIQEALSTIRATGRALPCHVTAVNGAIVTVAFDVTTQLPTITIPKAESNWIRMPTQVGDFGMVVPADAYLEPIASMASGQATLEQPSNLSGLLFVPVSNAKQPPVDQNAAQVQGPNGAIVQTTTGTTSSIITNTAGTTITFGSTTVKVSSSEITLTAGGTTLSIQAGKIMLDGIEWETHVHGGVSTGSSNTTGPQS